MIKPDRIDLEAIQSDLKMQEEAVKEHAGTGREHNHREQVERYQTELGAVKAYLAEQERVQGTTESAGFVFDTLEVDGLTAPEIITDDKQYSLIRKGVQNLVVTLTTANSKAIDELQFEVQTLNEWLRCEQTKSDQLQGDNRDLEVKNYELVLENDELSEKIKKIAQIQYEAEQQIEQQKQHIQDLQNQIAVGARGALNLVNMPQDTSALAAEIIASKPRITNVRFKDENGIDTRTKRAENVLTGDTFEYEALYEKRYIILNAEEAEQYRAEEANKKAELEAQNAIIPTIEQDIEPVNAVTETEEAAEIQPFPEEVQTADSGADQTADRDTTQDTLVEQTEQGSEVVTRAEFKALSDRVAWIEARPSLWTELVKA